MSDIPASFAMGVRVGELERKLAAAEAECSRWRIDYLSNETERSFLANSTIPELESKLAAAELLIRERPEFVSQAYDQIDKLTKQLAAAEAENERLQTRCTWLIDNAEDIAAGRISEDGD